MSHRFSTWWRALSVVLLSLAAVTWPSAARAATSDSFTLVHQGVLTTLSTHGTSRFSTTLRLAPHERAAVATESIFPPVTTRAEVENVVNGVTPSVAALATTGAFALNCRRHGEVTFDVTIDTGGTHSASATCHGVRPRLALACSGAACQGVYPLRLTLRSNGVTTTIWSMVVVGAGVVIAPLAVDFVGTIDANALAHPNETQGALRAIGRLHDTPLSIGVNYQPLATMAYGPDAAAWKGPMNAALSSALHRAVVAPPAAIDFSGLVGNGLTTQVAQQLTLSAKLLQTLTGRYADEPVVLSGRQTPGSLLALSGAGVSNVVLPEGNLTVAPSSTNTWGAPFHLEGAGSMSALSMDGPLSALLSNDAITPGRRAALVVATLAFLHGEDPNPAVPKTVVVEASLATTSKTFLDDLSTALHGDPYSQLAPLTASFNSSLIGSDGSPVTRVLSSNAITSSSWSLRNVDSLLTLIGDVTSYDEAIHSPSVAAALHVAVARAEILGSPNQRQNAITSADNLFNAQVAKFSIDASAITLAGQGTSLPITVMSHTGYPVTAVVHLVTDRLTFPRGSTVRVSMTSATQSIRVPTADPRGSSLTLQVLLTTPNGQVVLARGALQVRIAGTSVVGYLLTFASLFVLGLWWWRTIRRRPKGRHAK